MSRLWTKVFIGITAAMLVTHGAYAQTVSETVTYFHSDRLGSTVMMSDASGVIQSTVDYRPYGQPASGTASAAPGYTGQYNDPATGLTYMRARYYDSEVASFLSVDPVNVASGDVTGFGRYLYASNNPLRFVDPSGMSRCDLWEISNSVNDHRYRQWICDPGDLELWSGGGRSSRRTDGGGGGSGGSTPPLKCYAPFHFGESYPGVLAEHLLNMAAGLANSVKAEITFGPQISGYIQISGIRPAFELGMFNGGLAMTGAGDITLSVRSPKPGNLFYGEASLAFGPIKVGAARSSVLEGDSTHEGRFQTPEDGFSGLGDVNLWQSGLGKVGAHLQGLIGVTIEVDVAGGLRAVKCATKS